MSNDEDSALESSTFMMPQVGSAAMRGVEEKLTWINNTLNEILAAIKESNRQRRT